MARAFARSMSVPARLGVIATGIGALGAVAAAGVVIAVARKVVVPLSHRAEDVRILSVDPDAITLSASADTRLAGRYSLWFAGGSGHARLGEILSATDSTVTRQLLGVDSGDLTKASRGRFGGWFYLSPGDLGLPFETVVVASPLGPAPAWLVPAEELTGRWVIAVHGRGTRRAETLRALKVFHDAGYTALLISYRNDGDAPASPDGRYGLGDTEWQDVDAAIRFAVDRGASDIVLMGWSMGGAAVLQAATRSSQARLLRGLVLESPVVDWVTALHYQGALLGIAAPLRRAVLKIISHRLGGLLTGQAEPIDLTRLDFVARAAELTVPILLLHSDDDGFVPPGASQALALARPGLVSYERFHDARHAKLWNYDPRRWEAAIAGWLNRLAETSGRRGS